MSLERGFTLLKCVFGENNVYKEWDIAKEASDYLSRNLQYCPRIDFAVKPFNIDRGIVANNELINEAYSKFRLLIDSMKRSGLIGYRWVNNTNPRCFLVIEYENKTYTKHRLGSIINAGAIGKVGIIVAHDESVFHSYERIVEYINFLIGNEKSIIQTNFIVLKENSFHSILEKSL